MIALSLSQTNAQLIKMEDINIGTIDPINYGKQDALVSTSPGQLLVEDKNFSGFVVLINAQDPKTVVPGEGWNMLDKSGQPLKIKFLANKNSIGKPTPITQTGRIPSGTNPGGTSLYDKSIIISTSEMPREPVTYNIYVYVYPGEIYGASGENYSWSGVMTLIDNR